MASILFYENPVALSREAHKSTKVGQVTDFLFAAHTNSVILTGVEFAEACKEYPVVFSKTGDRIVPVALVGLRDSENLYVNADGKWTARYIPAFVRRYPFVLAETGGEEMAVCIDQSSPAFNSSTGEMLFDPGGGNTPYLDNVLNFINAFQAQFKRTESFVKHLGALQLLVEISAKAELADGRNYLLHGLLVVDEQKLQGLSTAKAQALLKTGELGWIYAHLISLSNISRMVDSLSARK